jgi:hypothetical protein
MQRKHSLDSKGKYFLPFLLLSDIFVSAPDTGKFLNELLYLLAYVHS